MSGVKCNDNTNLKGVRILGINEHKYSKKLQLLYHYFNSKYDIHNNHDYMDKLHLPPSKFINITHAPFNFLT